MAPRPWRTHRRSRCDMTNPKEPGQNIIPAKSSSTLAKSSRFLLPSPPLPSLPFSDILLPWNVECGGVVVYLQRWSFCAVKNVPDGMSHEMERAESSLQDDSADRAIYRVGLERANLQTVPCKGNLLTLPLTRVVLLAEQAGTSLCSPIQTSGPVVRLSDTRHAARRNATPEKWQREGEASEKKSKNITRTTLNFSWHRCLLSFFVSLLFVWFGLVSFFFFSLFFLFWGAKNPPATRVTTQQTRPLSELHIISSLSTIWLVFFRGDVMCNTCPRGFECRVMVSTTAWQDPMIRN